MQSILTLEAIAAKFASRAQDRDETKFEDGLDALALWTPEAICLALSVPPEFVERAMQKRKFMAYARSQVQRACCTGMRCGKRTFYRRLKVAQVFGAGDPAGACWEVHALAATAKTHTPDYWLAQAVEHQWSVADLRGAMASASDAGDDAERVQQIAKVVGFEVVARSGGDVTVRMPPMIAARFEVGCRGQLSAWMVESEQAEQMEAAA